MAYTPTVW